MKYVVEKTKAINNFVGKIDLPVFVFPTQNSLYNKLDNH